MRESLKDWKQINTRRTIPHPEFNYKGFGFRKIKVCSPCVLLSVLGIESALLFSSMFSVTLTRLPTFPGWNRWRSSEMVVDPDIVAFGPFGL